MIRQHRAWHAIMAIGQYTRSDDAGRGHAINTLEMYTRSNDFERGICHLRPWKDTRSNDVWRGMLSFPFENTNDWTTCGMACPHGT